MCGKLWHTVGKLLDIIIWDIWLVYMEHHCLYSHLTLAKTSSYMAFMTFTQANPVASRMKQKNIDNCHRKNVHQVAEVTAITAPQ